MLHRKIEMPSFRPFSKQPKSLKNLVLLLYTKTKRVFFSANIFVANGHLFVILAFCNSVPIRKYCFYLSTYISDGNSEIGMLERSNFCYLTCSRHLLIQRAVTNRIFFLQKDLFSFMRALHVTIYYKCHGTYQEALFVHLYYRHIVKHLCDYMYNKTLQILIEIRIWD